MEKAEKQGNAAFLTRGKAYVRPVLLGVLAGVLAGGGMLCLLAAVLGMAHATGAMIPAAAMAVAAAGGFFAGFTAAKARKKRGRLVGSFSALLVAAVILAVSWILSGMPEASVWSRALVVIVAGMIGGVLGVGKKGQPY